MKKAMMVGTAMRTRAIEANERLTFKPAGSRGLRGLTLSTLTLGLLGTGSAVLADDAIPSVTLPCANCSTISQLRATAHNYFNQYRMGTPPGFPTGKRMRPCVWSWWNAYGDPEEYYFPNCTVAAVVSTTYPLTATFVFDRLDDGVVTTSNLHTSNDNGMRDLDNRLNARSSEVPPFELPPSFEPSDSVEIIISDYLAETFPRTGRQQFDFWHSLTNFPQIYRYEYLDTRTGTLRWVHVNDTITIQYSNGWTEKLKLINNYSQINFQRVEGSLRDANGRDPTEPNSTSEASAGTSVEYSVSHDPGTSFFFAVPVHYNVPGSRIDRQGIVIIQQVFGGDKLLLFME